MATIGAVALEGRDCELARALASLPAPIRSVESLLARDTWHLSRQLPNVRVEELDALKLRVARRGFDGFSTGRELLSQAQGLGEALFSTGCTALDAALGGGLLAGRVTEVVGDSGSGKSQLCYTVACLGALRGAAVYLIDTTNSVSAKHLAGILAQRLRGDPDGFGRLCAARGLERGEASLEALVREALGRTRVISAYDADDVLRALDAVHDDLASSSAGAALAVLDSATAVLAPLLGGTMFAHGIMHAIVRRLRALATESPVPCLPLVVNGTVTDASAPGAPTSRVGQLTLPQETAGSAIERRVATENAVPICGPRDAKPALGAGWSYAAETRVLLVGADEPFAEVVKGDAAVRQAAPVRFAISGRGFGDA